MIEQCWRAAHDHARWSDLTGLPAVVGTGTATAVIRYEQVIEVDGTAGRVRMVSQNDNMQL